MTRVDSTKPENDAEKIRAFSFHQQFPYIHIQYVGNFPQNLNTGLGFIIAIIGGNHIAASYLLGQPGLRPALRFQYFLDTVHVFGFWVGQRLPKFTKKINEDQESVRLLIDPGKSRFPIFAG
jgi:hypothetical protein